MEIKKGDGFHIMMLISNLIVFRFWVEFLIVQLFMEVTISLDWDFCGEYRQLIAQVGGA